jgi:dihydropteroate synthase
MRGTPQTMNKLNEYENVTQDVISELNDKIQALMAKGMTQIIIDPGFGFAKNASQNFQLIKDLAFFHTLSLPLLIGVSRKRFIYQTLEVEASESLNGSTVIHTMALMAGASILRVHDVKEASQAIKLVQKVLGK